MGLYLFNLSVDTSDPNPRHIPEDLSINDQESMVELVAEQILGMEDAFEEFDDTDSEDQTSKKNLKPDFLKFFSSTPKPVDNLIPIRLHHFSKYEAVLSGGYTSISSPPPKW
ncbi:hypothetical protein [uncultured Algoriphagus sp.]|uniref:hypothetical protein n=1 Tax=uncultured Algoriphagus sp. TaxID=417365 RepID=UPI0030EEB2A6|tara:strand:- start:125210 stop:125545 length:336 start_codon:yes stop_codon:yes gene_type:complete